MRPRESKYLFFVLLLFTTGISYGRSVRAVPDSVVQQMKKDEAFWYANDPSFWTEEKPSPFLLSLAKFLSSDILRWTIYILLAAGLAFAIYRIILSNNFFTPRRSRKSITKKEKHYDEAPENIDERLAAAIARREYRLATRFYYLKTLSLLNSQNRIRLHAKSTNDEYVQQMSTQPNGRDFKRLTGIYEYVWYGEFQPSASQFEMISAGFNQFNRHS